MADEIKIRVAADISGLQSQMADGAEAVEDFGARSKAAMEAYNEASQGTAESQKILGEAFDQAKAAGAGFTESMEQAVAALNSYNATTAEAVAVTDAMAAAEARAAAGMNNLGVSATRSATAGFGIAEGRIMGANRAAAAFAATTLGLGPILQAAFPVIGAIALGEVLVQIGTHLYDVYEKAHNAGQEIERAFGDANLKVQATTDELELHNSKLQDEIDKLEGKPSNGLETALFQAIVAADKLQLALERDNKELAALLKEHSVGVFGGLIAGVAPTGNTEKQLTQATNEANDKGIEATNAYREAMHASAGDQKKQEELTRAHNAEMTRISQEGVDKIRPILNQYLQLQRDNNEKVAALHKLGIPAIPFTAGADIDYSANVNDAKGALQQLTQIHDEMLAMQDEEGKEKKLGGLKQGKENQQLANQAREKKLRDIEQEYSIEEQLFGKNANAAADYWNRYLNTFAQGTSQFETILTKYNAAVEQYGKKEPSGDLFGKVHEQAKKQNEELKKDADEYQKVLNSFPRGEKDMQEGMAKDATLQLTGQHEQALGSLELSHAQEESPYNIGTQSDAAKQLAELAKFHEAVLAENEAFVRKEIALAQGAGETDKAQELQNKLTEIQHKGDMQRLADQEAALNQQLAAFTRIYGEITNDLNSAIEKMITSTEKPAQIFAQMFNHILQQLANFTLQWIEKQTLLWARTQIINLLGLTTQKTTQATADAARTAQIATTTAAQTAMIATAQTAQTTAIVGSQALQVAAITTGQAAATAALIAGHVAQGASNVATVIGDAAVAAANTFVYYSAVDPPVAPAMAALAYGEVLMYAPLAAFEQGGIVNGRGGMPVPIMAHAGERVLSAPQTQNFERMVNNSSSSRSTNIHYNPSISGAFDHGSMKKMLSDQSEHILSIVRGGINSGKLRA